MNYDDSFSQIRIFFGNYMLFVLVLLSSSAEERAKRSGTMFIYLNISAMQSASFALCEERREDNKRRLERL